MKTLRLIHFHRCRESRRDRAQPGLSDFIPGFTASIFVSSLFPIALTLIYYDQRIRQEDFDIEMMMDAAGMNAVMVGALGVPSLAVADSGERPA